MTEQSNNLTLIKHLDLYDGDFFDDNNSSQENGINYQYATVDNKNS